MKSIKKSWIVLLTVMMPGLVTGMVASLLLPVWNTTVCADMTEADDSRLEEPEICYDTYTQTLHTGERWDWKPFANCPDLKVTYSSMNPKIVSVSEDGILTPLKEGDCEVTASTPKTDRYEPAEFSMYLTVLPAKEGLYVIEPDSHFYWQGMQIYPGTEEYQAMPLDVEKELCLKQYPRKDMAVFIEDYLTPCQKKTEDPTEAALNAIINYGADYYGKNFVFTQYGGTADAAATEWVQLLERRCGLCSPNASMFCYLMHLAGLPTMAVDSPLEQEERAHTWCLIEHDGYYYNLEEYHFLYVNQDRYVIPPLSVSTAAWFPGHVTGLTVLPFPVEGSSFTQEIEVDNMGRDLSSACPVLMFERLKDGKYCVRFETIRKGEIPTWEDGTPVSIEEIAYRNMETDGDGSVQDEEHQYNRQACEMFDAANKMLKKEIAPLFS